MASGSSSNMRRGLWRAQPLSERAGFGLSLLLKTTRWQVTVQEELALPRSTQRPAVKAAVHTPRPGSHDQADVGAWVRPVMRPRLNAVL